MTTPMRAPAWLHRAVPSRGALVVGFALVGCAGSRPPARDTSGMATRPPLVFDLDGPEMRGLDSGSTRGRTTVILFGTTYDLATQVEAKQLEILRHRQRPRINVGLVVLEPREYAPMAAAFQSSLGLSYPVVMADDQTRLGRGPFGAFPRIPTLVILDAAGRLHSRSPGLLEPAELARAVESASSSDGGGAAEAAR